MYPLFTIDCVYFKIGLISLATRARNGVVFFLLVYHVVSWLLTET